MRYRLEKINGVIFGYVYAIERKRCRWCPWVYMTSYVKIEDALKWIERDTDCEVNQYIYLDENHKLPSQ